MTNEAITGEVEQLYADYPYPAHGVVSGLIARMAKEPLRAARARVHGRPVTVLDAGCGTGEQTIGLAKRNPDVAVTGLDLSAASLDFARKLAAKSGARVRFERRNLLEPISDLGRFDMIVSVGVLHHLADPKRGLQTLRAAASDGTVLLGMVYGSFGRWDTERIRDALALLAAGTSRDERLALLRRSRLANNVGAGHYFAELRQRLRYGPDIAPLEAVRRVLRGRSITYQADTFVHPNEKTYTWAELVALLAETGWRFVGWPPRSGMPDDPAQLFGEKLAGQFRRSDMLHQASVYERVVKPAKLYFLASAA